MSKFKIKLYEKYISNSINESSAKKTALRNFIFSLGLDWTTLDRKKIDKIADTKRYKSYKGLKKIAKIAKEPNKLKETIDFEPSKKYKHIDKFHAKKKAVEAGFVAGGWSPKQTFIRTARKKSKFSKEKIKVGKLAYKQRKGYTTFSKVLPRKNTIGKTKEIRNLKKRKEYTGSSIRKIQNIYSSYRQNFNSVLIIENNKMSKVEKVLQKHKEIRQRNLDKKEVKFKKTLSGNSNTDTLEFNPNI